ncbi:hypothetical protein C7M84_021888, partial [Penaeus vannamei]
MVNGAGVSAKGIPASLPTELSIDTNDAGHGDLQVAVTADKCKITEGINHSLTIGEEYCITVNAKNAGTGAVTCRIRSTSGSDLDIDIEDNGDGTFSIYYTVKDAGEYTLSVKFGGQPVPDGFYSFT